MYVGEVVAAPMHLDLNAWKARVPLENHGTHAGGRDDVRMADHLEGSHLLLPIVESPRDVHLSASVLPSKYGRHELLFCEE